MRKGILFVILIVCSMLSLSAVAQNKGTSPKKNTATAKKVSNATDVSAEPTDDDLPPPPPQAVPTINFDTTAAPNDAFTKDIMELLNVIGAFEADVKAAEQSLKQSLGGATDANANAFYERFMFEMREGRARRWMTNLYVRTYRQNFTQDEVHALIAFYKTPLGKKLREATPLITKTVMMEGQKIGAYLGQTIMTDILNNK